MDNLTCFELSETDGAPDVAEVASFLDAASGIRQEQVAHLEGRRALFYAWHDAQAGQLRMSVARVASVNHLFRAPLRLIDQPGVVAAAFVGKPSSVISLEEFTAEASQLPEEEPLQPLEVWVVTLAHGGITMR
jgi:hypothetical protein